MKATLYPINSYQDKHVSSAGQSLVEVIVAAAALVFVLVAVVSGMILAVRNASFSNRQAQATKHTQETIEMFRNFQLLLGWEGFHREFVNDSVSTSFSYCLPATISQPDPELAATEFHNLAAGECVSSNFIPGTQFLRQVNVQRGTVTEPIEIEVIVVWAEGGQMNTSRSSANLYPRFEN